MVLAGENSDEGGIHAATRLPKADALTELGTHEGNAIARNWYLSVAARPKQTHKQK